jgi:hypothetical protein
MKEIVDSLDARQRALPSRSRCSRLRAAAALHDGVHRAPRVPVRQGTQRAVRTIALEVFRHLHALSLRFHLARQTGGLTRDVERGQRGISTLISFTLFSILPTLVEIGSSPRSWSRATTGRSSRSR